MKELYNEMSIDTVKAYRQKQFFDSIWEASSQKVETLLQFWIAEVEQSGIKEIIFLSEKYKDTPSDIASKRMLDMAGVKYRKLEIKKRTDCCRFPQAHSVIPTLALPKSGLRVEVFSFLSACRTSSPFRFSKYRIHVAALSVN